MLNFLEMLNMQSAGSVPSDIGIEARSIPKLKTFGIIKSDYFLGKKINDPTTVIGMDIDPEKTRLLYLDISTRKTKLKTIKFKGYYMKPKYVEKIVSKPIRLAMRPYYSEMIKNKKEWGINSISNKLNTFASMSYMYNLGYLLNHIKTETFGSGMLMSTKIRTAILDLIKKEVSLSTNDGRNKVIYFRGPVLKDTPVGLTITDSMMLKIWNIPLLFLEWFGNDPDGFKSWLNKEKVDIVFDNGVGQSIVLSHNETYQGIAMYNFKHLLKLIHKIDGSDLVALGVTPEEIKEMEIENAIISEPTEILSEEELTKLELTPAGPTLGGTVPDELPEDSEDVIDVEEVLTDQISDSNQEEKVATIKEMNKIFDTVPDAEKGSALLELHNFTALRKDVETETVKKMRKKMSDNFGYDVKEIIDNIKNHKIEVAHFNNKVDNDFNHSTFINLDKSYQDKLSDKDLENALIAPASLGYPLFLQSYEKIDISDREFRGHLLKATYLTHQGEELSFELEVPIVTNNSMFINGSNKYLTNQDLAKPIIKTDQNVIITTSYNKTILSIKGKYASATDKVMVKTMLNFAKDNDSLKVKTTEELSDFIYENRMSYRMLHLNKHFGGIRYKANTLDIDFDFRGKSKTPEGLTDCGHMNETPILHKPETDEFTIGVEKFNTDEIMTYFMKLIDEETYNKSLVTKLDNLNFVNGIYCTMMAREFPIVLIMLVETPLKDLLDRLSKENDLEYVTVSNDRLDPAKLRNTTEYGYIKLEDYTIRIKYNNTINQLILVPLVNMDLTKYNIFDIAHTLKDINGSYNTSIYLENFATSFIDAGTKRVLEMYNLPTDFTGLLIYAACLFYDHVTYYTSDATNYRLVTPTEVINRIVYEIINKEFSANVARTKRGSRQTIRIPKDSVTKSLQTTMANISEDSNVSPFRSISLKSSKSQKGHMGINMSRAYNMKRRMFNENNLGSETFATAYSGQAGIIKYLPFNPKLKDLTGAYANQNTPEGLDPSNMMTFVDSFVPYLNYDDSPRRIMTNGQFAHVLPIADADAMLVSYGADESALYMCPEFSYLAETDGEVISVNDKFVTVKYSDEEGTIVSYRLDNVERNSAKGYFLKNDFIVADDIKPGKKIKKGTPIAYNKDFFKKKPNGAIGLAAGILANALICDGEGTWEDACIISETTSRRMATNLIKRIPIKFNLETTDILDINLGIGQPVKPDTLLIKYNDLTQDESLNEFFSDVEGVNTTEVEAHYKGILNDITVFYRTSRDTVVTKSIKQFLRDIEVVQNNINHMSDLDKNNDKFGVAIKTSKPQLLTRGKFSKINGDVIENGDILIEFNIQIEDRVGPSDKLVVDRALKGEPSFVIPDEDRPVGALSGRVVDMMIDNQSVNARKTPGLPLHGQLLAILLHDAIKNRMIMNIPPEKGSLLDYKSSMDMVEGKLAYK